LPDHFVGAELIGGRIHLHVDNNGSKVGFHSVSKDSCMLAWKQQESKNPTVLTVCSGSFPSFVASLGPGIAGSENTKTRSQDQVSTTGYRSKASPKAVAERERFELSMGQ
jgi:hypothetical protein